MKIIKVLSVQELSTLLSWANRASAQRPHSSDTEGLFPSTEIVKSNQQVDPAETARLIMKQSKI